MIASQYEHHWSVVAILVIVDQTLSDTLTDVGAGAEDSPKLCQHGQVKHFRALAIVRDCVNLTKKQHLNSYSENSVIHRAPVRVQEKYTLSICLVLSSTGQLENLNFVPAELASQPRAMLGPMWLNIFSA